MNRNPLIPFALIAVFGIGLMFLLSFVGLGNMEEIAQGEDAAPQEDTAAATPEEIFQGKCAACHGADFGGGAGPDLHGVGDKYSPDEIKQILQEGRGIMQGGMVPAEKLDEMVEWLGTIE